MALVVWLSISLVYTSLIEYIAHRWFMHQPTISCNWLYVDHIVLQHGGQKMFIADNISPIIVSLLAAPLYLGCYWLGWTWCLAMLTLGVAYAGLWTVMHRALHEVGSERLIRWFPLYKQYRQHHLMHHKHPNRNFGTVCIWTDYFFLTKTW